MPFVKGVLAAIPEMEYAVGMFVWNHLIGAPLERRPSAAKWALVALITLSFISVMAFGQSAPDVSSLAGTWVVNFGNGMDRVYRIASDGSFWLIDKNQSKNGTITLEAGQFVAKQNDRIHRFTKLSDALLKVEYFDSKLYATNNPSSVWTAMLETKKALSATPPAPPVDTAPALTNTGTEAIPPKARSLVLANSWNTPLQGGSNTMDDLSRLFGGVTTAQINLSGDDSLLLYQNISYLMPIRQVIENLKLTDRLPSKVLLACPGLPRDSFFYYAVDGRFEGTFTRIYLVVDRADQLVCVQLVNEAPKGDVSVSNRDAGWHTYNFINTRTKALSTLRIEHKVILGSDGKWDASMRISNFAPEITAKNAKWTVLRVDSKLVQVDSRKFSHSRLLEEVRWYIPRPLVELILTCVQKAPR